MRKLSLSILLVPVFMLISAKVIGDSPHGKDFKLSCDLCHSSSSWKLDKSIYAFDHSKTAFPLAGQHQVANCRQCHVSLVFTDARKACVDCHTDMHAQTVGPDCGRCHTPKSWIVENITEIHQRSRFPLVGPHYTADCNQCHPSASLQRYDPRGVECWDCHSENYLATTSPNHVQGNYSKNCVECHSINSFTWTAGNIDHSFFPLKEGHSISCNQCHTSGNYSKLPTECVSCHIANYNATTNPGHASANIPTTCYDCHTLNPGWKPAEFKMHDQVFPVYSGKHMGTWGSCAECHNNPASYNVFTCIDCHAHNQPQMDEGHTGVGGYTYNSIACYECHPTGSKEGSFNHNNSVFPLTGAHTTTPCTDCHTNGFPNTPTDCFACHTTAYNQSANPGHVLLNLPTTCVTCHTTNPGWKPATFPIHGNYYPLTGGHATVADNCVLCHVNNNYTNTPNTCVACHQTNYNQTTNPNHTTLAFPTTCQDCHTTNPGWKPATFALHNNYYPLTGAHTTTDCNSCHPGGNYNNTPNTCVACHQANYNGTSNPPHVSLNFPTTCQDCHTTNPGWKPATFALHNNYYPLTGAHTTTDCNSCHQGGNYNNTPNTCVGCHQANYNGTNNPPHVSLNFPTTCQDCHTTNPGWKPATFTLHNNYYPLTGAHTTVECNNCHVGGNYTNTPNTCVGCHQTNYNQSTNPPHASLNFPTTCQDCHTTNPGWKPATFTIHNNYYVLQGAHLNITCNACHNGNYNNNLPTTCIGCHQADYNSTTNPPHASAQFPTECEMCHTQNAWIPSTFNHDGQYFPIYSGKHNGTWTLCSDCHTNSSNYKVFSCITCHEHNKNDMDSEHNGVSGYSYNSDACYNCHPNGNSGGKSPSKRVIINPTTR